MDSLTILAIDADAANRNFLALLLHKKNFHVRQASSGEEGIRMAGEAAPSKGGKTAVLSLDGKIQNVSGEKRLHLWENL